MALLVLNRAAVEAERFYAFRLVLVRALGSPVPGNIKSTLTDTSNIRLRGQSLCDQRPLAISDTASTGGAAQ